MPNHITSAPHHQNTNQHEKGGEGHRIRVSLILFPDSRGMPGSTAVLIDEAFLARIVDLAVMTSPRT